ncbi:MAG: DUF5674 family protein [Lachnospiraceae bacterium]|nr:DUF5674 family protein [Lachnospiraceae bacterium]
MQILKEIITKDYLNEIKDNYFGDMVKAVVDIDKELLGIDAELHADIEELFIENGSKQENLWGINLYPEEEDFIEFDSLINIRPRQNNKTRGVNDENTRKKIIEVVNKWVK